MILTLVYQRKQRPSLSLSSFFDLHVSYFRKMQPIPVGSVSTQPADTAVCGPRLPTIPPRLPADPSSRLCFVWTLAEQPPPFLRIWFSSLWWSLKMNLSNLLAPSSCDPSYNSLPAVSIPLPPGHFKVPMPKAKPSLPLLPSTST